MMAFVAVDQEALAADRDTAPAVDTEVAAEVCQERAAAADTGYSVVAADIAASSH